MEIYQISRDWYYNGYVEVKGENCVALCISESAALDWIKQQLERGQYLDSWYSRCNINPFTISKVKLIG